MSEKHASFCRLSIVVPALNETGNIAELYKEIVGICQSNDYDYEILIIDDHSTDDTFLIVQELASADLHVRGIRFSRNSGSHKAIYCGLKEAEGDCVIVMAADLQDPPDTIPRLVREWRNGAQVVWAVRDAEDGQAAIGSFSRLYYWLMRNVFGAREMPGTGADFFLLDRRVVDALKQYKESNTSVLGLLMWMGFRQARVFYKKQSRRAGSSGWTLKKKIKLLVDSITSFSYLPVRIMSVSGFVTAIAGFVYALVVVVNALLGRPIQGWSSLMMVILIIGGMQMLMMGVLGEYVWRALDESRRRPLYLVEADTREAVNARNFHE